MTTEKARTILGKYAQVLSDKDVQLIIDTFNGLIEVGFRHFEKNRQIESDAYRYNIKKTL